MRTFCKAAPLALFIAVAAPARGQVINEDTKLLAGDGAAYDRFGLSIAIDNGVVAVGAHWHEDNGIQSGSAYLFNAATGAQIAELLPSDAASDDRFGVSIAVDNGVVVVGARLDDDNGTDSGSAYLFNASTGAQLAKLLPTDGVAGDNFGFSIAIDNGVVAVGADSVGSYSGSACLFNASTRQQFAKLRPSDLHASSFFGGSIAIDNGVVAVGARGDRELDGNHPYVPGSGAAYLFNAATGTQIAKLLPSDGTMGDQFGFSIAIGNGIVAIGAPQDDDAGSGSGAAYLFNASTGTQIAKLLPSDGASGNNFGDSIAIDNGVVAVGAFYDDDNGFDSGSAYLFNAATGTQIAKLLASDAVYLELLGRSVAIDNGVVAVGAPDSSSRSGSAYLFPACLKADIDGDGTLTANLDVPAFVSLLLDSTGATQQEACAADMNSDGNIDGLDTGLFVAAMVP